MGDFNNEPVDTALSYFCNLIKEKLNQDKTCSKNSNKRSCIDMITTKRPKSFQNFIVIETRLSGFPTMCVAVMKIHYNNQKPTIIHDCKYEKFNNDVFIKDLNTLISK